MQVPLSPPRAHAAVRSVPRGPGFGPFGACNSRHREAAASAFTAPHPVDLDDGHAEPSDACAGHSAGHSAGQEKDAQRVQRLQSLSAEAHKEACGASILLGKLLAALVALLFLWWTFQLWNLQQHDAAQVRGLQAELAAAGTQVLRLKDQRDELRSLQMALRHEKADAEKRAYSATSELGDRDGQLSDLEEELQATDDIADKLQRELADGATALEESQQKLSEVRGKVKRGQSKLETQQGEIVQLQGEISQLQNHLKAAEGRYNQSSASLEDAAKQRKELQQHQGELQQQLKAAEGRYNQSSRSLEDAAKQRKELQQQQGELQQQLKAAHGQEVELRRQLKAAQQEHGVQLREAAQHEAKAVSKVQEQVKSNEDLVQKLLRQLALAAQQRDEGEEKLATLQSKLQTKERWAKDIAQSLEQLMDSDAKAAPRPRQRRLKIK